MENQQLDIFQYSWQQKFFDEETCRNFLFHLRWPHGFRCPKCSNNHYYTIAKRNLYECSDCRHQTSVIAETFMHKTRVPLTVWFRAIYTLINEDDKITAAALSRILKITNPTAWLLKDKIEKAMNDPNTKDFILKIAKAKVL